MARETQCERILHYMRAHDGITGKEASDELGCMRLASRICDLRQSGYSITGTSETAKNRYGETTHYIRYRLND